MSSPSRPAALSGGRIPYTLVRVRRRSIGLQISDHGLVVRAPTWVSKAAIEEAIADKARWITSKLEAQRAQTRLVASDWKDGGSVLFGGERVPLIVRESLFEGTELNATGCAIYAQRPPEDAAQIAAQATTALKEYALKVLPPLVKEAAQALGASPQKIRINDTRTLWGSCSFDGTIRLTFRLVQVPPALMRYVVIHEVAHLLELNHSPKFWAHVARLDPQYKTHRAALKQYAAVLLGD